MQLVQFAHDPPVAVDPPNDGVSIYKYDEAGQLIESWLCSEMEHTEEVHSSGAFDDSKPVRHLPARVTADDHARLVHDRLAEPEPPDRLDDGIDRYVTRRLRLSF